jgi:hypothetical protein
MKEMILSVVCFHWLATLAVGVVLVRDALRRPLRRTATWIFPAPVVHTLHSVLERQDAQSEPAYSRAA